jgi:hypothetical protein
MMAECRIELGVWERERFRWPRRDAAITSRVMDIGPIVVGLGVPVVSFLTGLAATGVTQLDRRARLRRDLALLKELPEDADSRQELLENVDRRVAAMIQRNARPSKRQAIWERVSATPLRRTSFVLFCCSPALFAGYALLLFADPKLVVPSLPPIDHLLRWIALTLGWTLLGLVALMYTFMFAVLIYIYVRGGVKALVGKAPVP